MRQDYRGIVAHHASKERALPVKRRQRSDQFGSPGIEPFEGNQDRCIHRQAFERTLNAFLNRRGRFPGGQNRPGCRKVEHAVGRDHVKPRNIVPVGNDQADLVAGLHDVLCRVFDLFNGIKKRNLVAGPENIFAFKEAKLPDLPALVSQFLIYRTSRNRKEQSQQCR